MDDGYLADNAHRMRRYEQADNAFRREMAKRAVRKPGSQDEKGKRALKAVSRAESVIRRSGYKDQKTLRRGASAKGVISG